MNNVITDVDGCVSAGRWLSINWGALRKLSEYRIFFSSGRSQPYIECLSQTIGSLRPFISENGSAIFSPEQNRYTWIAPNAALVANQKQDILRRLSGALLELEAVLEPGKDFSLSLSLLTAQGQTLDMALAHQKVVAALGDMKGISVTHSNSAVDIIGAGVNKGSALVVLADQLGLAPSDFAGFGDSSNDLSFLSLVGFSGCPANATASVKAAVEAAQGYCSPHPDIQGLLDFIAVAQSRS